MTIFLDIAPVAGGVGVVAGVVFFFVLAVAAFVAFKLLKRTVKMVFRLTIVAIILVVAVVGSISFYFLGTSKSPRPTRPATSQQK